MINKIRRAFVMLYNTVLWIFLYRHSIVLNVFADQIGLRVKHKNFGDDLNFYIVSFLTDKHVFIYNSFFHPNIKNYVCIGSIVEDMTNSSSIIWGGGVMNDSYNEFIKPKEVCAVRGPLTKEYLEMRGVKTPAVYGDPALLTPMIYHPKVKKTKMIGIIPHFSELSTPRITEFVKKHDVLLIDMQNYKKWTDIIDQISQCEMIASSSLHGLIISDAYGIPNVWMCLDKKTGGGEFKFRDYFGGVQRKFERYMVKEEIELEEIIKYCGKYQGITFDKNALLGSCPFMRSDK